MIELNQIEHKLVGRGLDARGDIKYWYEIIGYTPPIATPPLPSLLPVKVNWPAIGFVPGAQRIPKSKKKIKNQK